jgi:CPA1 family monovalent cation:H+ antiporter
VTILEGESLVNDATALIAYRFSVAAVVGGAFSLWDASLQFVLVGAGGILLGLACGWVLLRLMPMVGDASLQIAASLVAPSAIFILAEETHVSGVLAVVTAGLFFGRNASRSFNPESRLGGFSVWQTGLVLINGLVFILIGLQLGTILDNTRGDSLATLLGQALLISLAVVIARFIWVFPATYLPRWLVPSIRWNDPAAPWKADFLISWSGLRGVVSLASALALPHTIDAGNPFPWRDEIVLVTFVVIVVTLLGQGLPLPWILGKLRLQDDGAIDNEIWIGRRIAAEAVVDRLKALEGEAWVPDHHAAVMRYRYEHMLREIPASSNDADLDLDHLDANDRLRTDVVEAARAAVIQARNEGTIGDAARFRVETELDREYVRTEL